MTTYSDTVAITAGTSEVSGDIDVPAGGRIIGLHAMSLTGTGCVYQMRLKFAGMESPQTYLLPVLNALDGTEVGSGAKQCAYLDVDIPIPAGVSKVTVYLLASAASQSSVAGLIWVA